VGIRTIVFDFGNVVGFFDHRLTTNRLAPHAGVSADALHALLFTSALAHEFEKGNLTTDEFWNRVQELGQLRCGRDFFATAWSDIFWPNLDVIVCLPYLRRHYRLLLASNTNEPHARQFTRQFEAALARFDGHIFSHQLGARKPEARFYQACTDRAECPPNECLFIDDLRANVEGARACGWNAAIYQRMADLRAAFAEFGIGGLAVVSAIKTL
jgi:putative hydrolase of the HAD superfamily